MSAAKIADTLNEKGILSPVMYKNKMDMLMQKAVTIQQKTMQNGQQKQC